MGGTGGLGLELPRTVRIRVERAGGGACRVDLNPEREKELDSYLFFLVSGAFSKAIEVAERKPGLDIVLECSGPRGDCRCTGVDCDVVERVEAYGWEEFWWETHLKETIILVSTRWVSGCGTHTRVYLWPPNRIIVSHDTAGYNGVHIVYLDIERLREKVFSLRGEEG